jgi:hypothetical protein
MGVTYRVIEIEQIGDQSKVIIQVGYMGKYKILTSTIPTDGQTQAQLCTLAWQNVKSEADLFVTQVTNGNFLIGSVFTPQEDGTILF